MFSRFLLLLVLVVGLSGTFSVAGAGAEEQSIEGYTPAEIAADPSLLVEVCAGLQAAAATALEPPDPAELFPIPAGESGEEGAEVRTAPFDLEAQCAAIAGEVAALVAGVVTTGKSGTSAGGSTGGTVEEQAVAAGQTVKSILASGRIATGSVTVTGPATVRRSVWLTAPSQAGGKGAKKAKAKRVLVGKVTRVVGKQGAVDLVVRLTSPGRKALRAVTGDVRLTLETTSRLRKAGKGKKASSPVTSQLAVKFR